MQPYGCIWFHTTKMPLYCYASVTAALAETVEAAIRGEAGTVIVCSFKRGTYGQTLARRGARGALLRTAPATTYEVRMACILYAIYWPSCRPSGQKLFLLTLEQNRLS